MFWAFTQMGIVCNFGEIMSNKFGGIDDTIYGCDWYTFPNDIQRMLPIILAGAQQPVILMGFANLTCTREAFKKVGSSTKSIKNVFILI